MSRPGRGAAPVRITSRVRWAVLLVLLAVVVPGPSSRPAPISLVTVETASTVDFREGVVWVLALGSDARPGQTVTSGNTDVVELIGVHTRTGRAVGIGIPRDAWVGLPDGRARINEALARGGPRLAASAVRDLVGVAPDLVLVTGFDGFTAMLGAVGEVVVESPDAYRLEDVGLDVRRGPNVFGPADALAFARSRDLVGDDFARAANHQALLRGIVRAVHQRHDRAGFVEAVTVAATLGLETDLPPAELYRLVQVLTLVDPSRVDGCVVRGTPVERSGASVVLVDRRQALALGADAGEDARLQRGCR